MNVDHWSKSDRNLDQVSPVSSASWNPPNGIFSHRGQPTGVSCDQEARRQEMEKVRREKMQVREEVNPIIHPIMNEGLGLMSLTRICFTSPLNSHATEMKYPLYSWVMWNITGHRNQPLWSLPTDGCPHSLKRTFGTSKRLSRIFKGPQIRSSMMTSSGWSTTKTWQSAAERFWSEKELVIYWDIYIYVIICDYMYICICPGIQSINRELSYVYVYVYSDIYICVCVYIYISIYIYMCVYIYI